MILSIDLISDVICPWCFIGKRRLEKALAALDRQHEVRVRWLPFQLNPQMPKEGISRREYRTKKFGSWERSQELDVKMVAAGETEGIHFAFDRTERGVTRRPLLRVPCAATTCGGAAGKKAPLA
jgi:predicted DsbA family dithiol-disulfide isomerase